MEHPDADLVASIKDDVIRILRRKRFFDRLDDILCPADGVSPGICNHSYAISEGILKDLGFNAEDLQDIFAVLQSEGGFCDCEILYNAPDSNRLQSSYWRKRSEEG